MNNQTLIGIIVVIVLVAGGYFLVTSSPTQTPQENSTATSTQQETATTTGEVPVTPTTYTLAQVAIHKDATSCWSAVKGSVYDLTSWIGKHPGGDKAILSICGKDGTSAFEKQHGGMQQQEAQLATFKIGALAQ
jgi:cytochrome b involved in lipid metabolism